MEVQHKLNDQDIHQKSFHHHLKQVKANVASNILASKDNLINMVPKQIGTFIFCILVSCSYLMERCKESAMYNNLPKNGGMEDKMSILPYKNPMPVGPHICNTHSTTYFTCPEELQFKKNVNKPTL